MAIGSPLRAIPNMSLAILDWGIGGVPTFAAIRQCAPDLDLVYVSDSGFTPYGQVPKLELAKRLDQIALSLGERGVTQIAIACNAASSAIDGMTTSLPVAGIIQDGVELALASNAGTIAVLGGEGTIRSAIHEAQLHQAGRKVIPVASQVLSAHVEAGRLKGPLVERDVEAIVHATTGADVVLLACTHYPALTPIFRKYTSVPLLDPCARFASRVVGLAAKNAQHGSHLALTTGDPAATSRAAQRAFGIDMGPFESFLP